MSKSLTNLAESIYKPLVAINEQAPANQVGTTETYFHYFTLGNAAPTGWTGCEPLGSMVVTQGTGNNQRVGSWAYLKKTHMTISIDMKPNTVTGQTEATEFRFIVVKAKPASRQFGSTYTPDSTLFYDTSGSEFGPDSTGIKGADIQLQPINKRRWSIFYHKKFILVPPGTVEQQGAMNSFYPSRKVVNLNLPFYKKVRFNSANEPQDIDTKYAILIFSTPVAKNSDGTRHEINIRGTTSFIDV